MPGHLRRLALLPGLLAVVFVGCTVAPGPTPGQPAPRDPVPSAPAPASEDPAPDNPPNILLILLDDVGYGDLTSDHLETPRLGRFAAQGMTLSSYYANAAVCSPTRAALLTGRYPQRYGLLRVIGAHSRRGLPATPSLPRLLRQRGYRTGHVGKWHLGDSRPEYLPTAWGYERSARLPTNPDSHFDLPLFWDGAAEGTPQKGHSSQVLTDAALALIDAWAEDDAPFFLTLWHFAPHDPWEADERWLAAYPDTAAGRYGAVLSQLDHEIGRLLDHLDHRGLADDTLVVIASDNGGAGGGAHPQGNGPLTGFKGQLFEGGIRVPFLARWPGRIPAGRVNDSVIVGFDLFPTLDELTTGLPSSGPVVATSGAGDAATDDAGATPSEPSDGSSFLQVLLQDRLQQRSEPLFWTAKAHGERIPSGSGIEDQLAVRRGASKLLFFEDRARFFRLGADRLEETEDDDLGATAEARELWRRYWAWHRQAGRIPVEVTATEGAAEVTANGFDLQGGAVLLADHPQLDIADGSFTLLATITPQSLGRQQVILGRGDGWRLILDTEGRLRLRVSDDRGRSSEMVGQRPLAAGTPTRVAATFHGWSQSPSSYRLYLDGSLQGVVWTGARRVASSRAPLRLGSAENGSHPFLGTLTNLELHALSLTAEEIRGELPPYPEAAE